MPLSRALSIEPKDYAMASPMTERVLNKARAQAPATITKQSRGKPTNKPRTSFQAFTVSQLLETYRDPRAILLELASMDTIELAKLCQCSILEAIGERRLCAQAVLPYVAQKLPVQVDMRHTKAIHLNIVDSTQYQELQAIAGDAMQLVTGQVIESAIAEDGEAQGEQLLTDESEQTDVQPPVPATPGSTE